MQIVPALFTFMGTILEKMGNISRSNRKNITFFIFLMKKWELME